MMDRLELELGLGEKALELLRALLIEPLVVVIESNETAEAAIDLLRGPDGSHHMMTARTGWIEGTPEQLHRFPGDELVEPLLGQGKPAADEGAVLLATAKLNPALLVLQP
jgi:hypothetical protein